MKCCVSESFASGDEEAREKKIEELTAVFDKLVK